MRTAIHHPLISGMDIRRELPVHESSRRLRGLFPACPLVYGIAVLDDVARHRWWPLDSTRTDTLLRAMFDDAVDNIGPHAAARQLAASLIHEIIGRMLPLVLLEGRAWDVGLENLWLHRDRDGAIDWAAVVDPTLRVLPDDPCVVAPGGDARGWRARQEGLITLPNEGALAIWVAHRCHRSLTRLFDSVHAISNGAVSITAMWHIVGSATIGVAAQIPRAASVDDHVITRRSQAILDAMVGFGLPVRRSRCAAAPLLTAPAGSH
ncbi:MULTISPECIES: iron reductase [Mycobacterium]|uniref:iron reductase n=1 Tax=Mycobacterium TaxID=1763 RepID=UPI001CD98C9D|nr:MULTISPECIES: iron reductase [Mycobacterium]MCA2242329.1 iron reductase [Mycobacterium sp. WUMAC-067]MCA2313636.1 iron reductase [Mycobacterium sp. WUMAC-025]MEE3754717.1 iron reductase [Mycobacterium intracellulare]